MWGQEVKISHQERLKQMTSLELIHKGERFRMKKNMPDSALLYLSIVANRPLSRKDKKDTIEVMSHIAALHGLGILYSGAYFDYKKAYGYYLQAESMAKKYNRTLLLPSIHHNMLGLKKLDYSVNRRDKVVPELLNDYKQLVREAVEYHAMLYYPLYVASMASLAQHCKMVDSIKPELENYLKMKLPETALFPQEVYRLFCLAVMAYSNKEYEKAFAYLDQQKEVILSNSNDSNFHAWLTDNNYTRCEFLWGLGKDEEGLALIQENLRLGQQADNHLTMGDAYSNLMDYYREHGNEQLAQHYELLYLREKNYIENQNHLLDVDKVKFLFEIEEMNEEARVQAERERMKTYVMWGIALVAIILVILVVMLIHKYRQEQEKNSILYQRNLEMLAAHAEEVKRLEQAVAASKERPAPKYDKNPMGEEQRQELMYRVYLVMEKSEEVYQEGFTLERLAELVESKSTYVSYVINEKSHCNFNALLNEYRIKEACRRMNDSEHFGHLTIEGIAASVGIKSRTNFSNNFKKITGLTPSEYQRQQRKKPENGGDIVATESGHI